MKHLSKLTFSMIIFSIFTYSCSKAESKAPNGIILNKLTPDEERIMLKKGTEKAYTGTLLNNKVEGVYVCKQCNNQLFLSSAKFDSKTGWPSFDDVIENAVKEVPDFFRTEVVCSVCDGHLGHVFRGEGFTTKDARYCINSLALNFVANK